jgi:hypothetical protein
MTDTHKVETWPADLQVLEAASCQFGRCNCCGAFVLALEAADSSFAIAHVGDDDEALKQWFADSLAAASN